MQGRDAERAVSVSDFRDPDALVYVQQRLQRIGVDRAFARAGARDGDVVRIGEHRARVRGELVSSRATGAPLVRSRLAIVKVGTSSVTRDER